ARGRRATGKSNHFLTIIQHLYDYPKRFIAGADNVGSKQMQQIHTSLRGKTVVLTGNTTMMCEAIRGHLENSPALEKLLAHIWGNLGLMFTKEDLTEIRDMLLANKVPAAACAGVIVPREVTPAQNTSLGPKNTTFFQALGITTKISRGTIEILDLRQSGSQRSHPTKLLNLSSFFCGLIIPNDDSSIYNPEVLDIEEELHSRFLEGVPKVASVSLQIGHPAVDSVSQSIINRYKWILAVSVKTNYTFALCKVKIFLADPSTLVVAAPLATAPTAVLATALAPAVLEVMDKDMRFGLFD
uniref:Large ribosomal subunit protein uL10 n=1 Tax=Loxodonta africana TaxID=9785 RepID=G3U8Q8_LOXAF